MPPSGTCCHSAVVPNRNSERFGDTVMRVVFAIACTAPASIWIGAIAVWRYKGLDRLEAADD